MVPIFTGKGIWVWNPGDPAGLCGQMATHRFGYLAIKAHDGVQAYNNPATIERYRTECRSRNLAFGVWGYLRGQDPAGEARLAAQLCRQHSAAFYIADAEVEYERATQPVSRTFAQTFRSLEPGLPAALSTFGRIDLHPGIDYASWAGHSFVLHPQAYECETEALAPAKCVSAATKVWPASQIHPTLGAYKGANGRPDGAQLASSLKGLPTMGFNVWEASTMVGGDFSALGNTSPH